MPFGEPNQGRRRGYGYAKILKKHPDVCGSLQPLLHGMEVVEMDATVGQIVLASPSHRAVVNTRKATPEGDQLAITYLATLYRLRAS